MITGTLIGLAIGLLIIVGVKYTAYRLGLAWHKTQLEALRSDVRELRAATRTTTPPGWIN